MQGIDRGRAETNDNPAVRWFDDLVSDVRMVGRLARRAPIFAATAIAMLVAGIGATTVVYSVLRQVLLQPLPYSEPDRIVQLFSQSPVEVNTLSSGSQFRFWHVETSRAFDALGAYQDRAASVTLSSDGRLEPVRALRVSSEFFAVFRLPLALGRTFQREEDVSEGPRIVVLTEGFWHRHFGGRDVLGQSLWLGNEPHEIIGVLARSFVSDPAAEVFVALRLDATARDETRRFRVVGRLRSDISLDAARRLVAGTTSRYRREHPFALGQREYFTADTLHAVSVGPVKPTLQLLSGAVALVLLVACANVATLLLSRGRLRVAEVATRTALGASRRRVVRQLLTESMCLALAGAALALPIAQLGLQAVLRLSADGVPGAMQPLVSGVTLDAHLIGVGLAAGIVTGLLCGVIPSISTSRADLSTIFKSGASSAVTSWRIGGAQSTLLLAQVAIALVLLASTVSVLESLGRLRNMDRGFDASRVLTLEMPLAGTVFADGAALDVFVRNATRRLEDVTGVSEAAAAFLLPTDQGATAPFVMNDRALFATGSHHGSTRWEVVTPEYFAALGITRLDGRLFSGQDVRGAPPVAIINRTLARRFWGNRDVMGERITLGSAGDHGDQMRTIVGVVADTRGRDTGDSEPTIYVPMAQAGNALLQRQQMIAPLRWLVRTSIDPRLVGPASFTALEQAAPGTAVSQPKAMSELLGAQVARARFALQLLGTFAAMSVMMVLVGLYGFVNNSVTQRTKELCIRNALGASRGQLLRLILGQGAAIVAGGIVVGVLGATLMGAGIEHYVFGVKALAPSTLAAIALLQSLAAATATVIAALPAAEVDPRRVID